MQVNKVEGRCRGGAEVKRREGEGEGCKRGMEKKGGNMEFPCLVLLVLLLEKEIKRGICSHCAVNGIFLCDVACLLSRVQNIAVFFLFTSFYHPPAGSSLRF